MGCAGFPIPPRTLARCPARLYSRLSRPTGRCSSPAQTEQAHRLLPLLGVALRAEILALSPLRESSASCHKVLGDNPYLASHGLRVSVSAIWCWRRRRQHHIAETDTRSPCE